MPLVNAYVTVAEFDEFVGEQVSATDLAVKESSINAASRAIDAWCGRRFWNDVAATARVFVPPAVGRVLITDDFSTTAGLIVSDGGTVLTSGQYQVEPLNQIGPIGNVVWAYSRIRRLDTQWSSPTYPDQATITVTAQWGWPSVPPEVKHATFVLASKFFKLKDAPLGVAGFGEFGAVRVQGNRDVEALLASYRRFDVTMGIA